MIDVPAARPVAIPVPASTDALAGTLLVHTPPDGVVESGSMEPTQMDDTPLIAAGISLTVTSFVLPQPVLSV